MIDIFKHTKTIVRMLARESARALNQMSVFVYMYKIAKMQNKSEKQISTRSKGKHYKCENEILHFGILNANTQARAHAPTHHISLGNGIKYSFIYTWYAM